MWTKDWNSLQAWHPCKHNKSIKPIRTLIPTAGINGKNYLTVYTNTQDTYINQYNIQLDEWNQLIELQSDESISTILSTDTRNTEQSILLMSTIAMTEIKYSNNQSSIKIKEEEEIIFGQDKGVWRFCDQTPAILQIEQELYLIGDHNHDFIVQWNPNKFIFEEILQNNDRICIQNCGIVYDKSCKMVYLFGGFDFYTARKSPNIFLFDIVSKKCVNLSVTLPKSITQLHCVLIFQQQLILICGGYIAEVWGGFMDDTPCTDEILIFNVRDYAIRQSNFKCPAPSYFTGIAVNDVAANSLIVFGYTRESGAQMSPDYLVQIIIQYYSTEDIYLLDRKNGLHYKMNSFPIVCC